MDLVKKLDEADALVEKMATERAVTTAAAVLFERPDRVVGKFEGNEEFPVQHHFANGVYCRQTFLPKGSVGVGRKHRFETNNILASGKVATINAGVPDEIRTAPCVFKSPAGTQRVFKALEDTMWITTHPIDPSWTVDDLDKIEAFVAIDQEPPLLEEVLP